MTLDEATIAENLQRVRSQIHAACARVGRSPEEVELVAVSKKQPVAAIEAAYRAGQRRFAENYVQELLGKNRSLARYEDLQWHFVGHLQRNKVGHLLAAAPEIETVDSIRLAEVVSRRAVEQGVRVQVFIQVNLAAEPQKAGCAPSDCEALAQHLSSLEAIELCGLMTVPPRGESEATRTWFSRLRELAENVAVKGLSMGMSDDFEIAVEEGATRVRIGRGVFGER